MTWQSTQFGSAIRAQPVELNHPSAPPLQPMSECELAEVTGGSLPAWIVPHGDQSE